MELVNLSELKNEQNILLVNKGISYAMQVAYKDSKLYEKYKKGESTQEIDGCMLDMDILVLLEKLGFPMNQLGTYLYKDVIKEVVGLLEKKEDEITLTSYLNNAYSSIYLWVAKDDKEMGLKTFHSIIIKAIDQINSNIMDKKLVIDIFGIDNTELNYGLLAYKLSEYVNNINIMTNKINVNNVKVKKLSNISLDK